MNAEETSKSIGSTATNLLSAEFVLRMILSHKADPPKLDLDGLKKGYVVAEEPRTNWDSLSAVVTQVNNPVERKGLAERFDAPLVELRVAMAHGLAFAATSDGPHKVVRFGRPKEGSAPVESVVELEDTRLRAEVGRTGAEVRKALTVAPTLGALQ
jgi:hypothetical protein